MIALTAVAATPFAIDAATASRDFGCAGFRLRVAAALAAVFFFAAFGCFDFFAARFTGRRALFAAFAFFDFGALRFAAVFAFFAFFFFAKWGSSG